MHRVDIDATLKMTQGQGHKVKGQGRICNCLKKNCLGYKSQREDHIMIKLIHRIDLATLFKVVQGQGHKVKVKYKNM